MALRRRGNISCLTLLIASAIALPQAWACIPTETGSAAYIASLEQTVILAEFNRRLLAGSSATRVLEAWCASHRLAAEPRIAARRVTGAELSATPQTRERLKVGPEEPLRYRHVHLMCGNAVLSIAENWYVPSRLTPEMNNLLDISDTPFGVVVAPLGISRRTVAVEELWHPLVQDWELHSSKANQCLHHTMPLPPEIVLRHKALVLDKNMLPIAEVVENYTAKNLVFPRGN